MNLKEQYEEKKEEYNEAGKELQLNPKSAIKKEHYITAKREYHLVGEKLRRSK